ncbi:MAG: tRNA pseudouridine(38-40) synthase TruA [bacterium]|nr:tRNA pseudouridine(38-40) synthase TruA [bacterium]
MYENNYLAIISYIGTNYNGWQRQKEDPLTVQEIVTKTFENLLNTTIKKVSYTGRTDKGVSALFQYFNFYIKEKINPVFYIDIVKKANMILPSEVLVLDFTNVDNSFSSRYDVKYKTYLYKIIFCDDEKIVIDKYGLYNYLLMKFYCKDYVVSKLNEFIPFFNGLRDYTSYHKPEKGVVKNTVLDLSLVYFIYDYPEFWVLTFEFKAAYFLRNMIRKIMGIFVAFLEDRVDINYIRESFDNPDPSKGKFVSPPGPLVLYSVKYGRWLY